MSKIVISDFSGGIGLKDRLIPANQFYVGDGIDLHSLPGYIRPSLAVTSVQDTTGSVLLGTPTHGVVDSANGKVYIIDASGNIYQISDIDANTFNSNFDGSAHYYYAIPSYSNGGGLAMYNVSGTPKLFFSYNTSSHAYVGTYDLSSTFAATKVDLGSSATNYQSPHQMKEWNTVLWITNGRYIASYNGATDATNNQALDLGQGWIITSIFTTENYLGICASKNLFQISANNFNPNILTETKIFYWDGVSSTYNKSTTIQDNKIGSSINHNGTVYLTTQGRNNAGLLGELTNSGMSFIRKLNLMVNGSTQNIAIPFFQSISVCNNKVFLSAGGGGTGANILSFGREQDSEKFAFSFPYRVSTNTTNYVLFTIQAKQKLYIGWFNTLIGGAGVLSQVDLTSSTYGTATYKAGYYDFGQKVKLLSVDFYFQTLASGQSASVSVDYDYGTSGTLKDPAGNSTISFAIDGAITRKRFKLGQDVHAVRPVINWTSGGMAISKIVLNYGPTPDDF